jgi:hypothetical protein
MEVSKKQITVSIVSCLVVGTIIGTIMGQKMSQSGTQIITKDRIVTVERQVTRPDGTVERDTTRVEDRRTEAVTVAKPDWAIGASYGITGPVPSYGISIHKRVFMDVFVGVTANTRGEVMASALITF